MSSNGDGANRTVFMDRMRVFRSRSRKLRARQAANAPSHGVAGRRQAAPAGDWQRPAQDDLDDGIPFAPEMRG